MLLSLVPAMGVTASAADDFVEVSTYDQLKTAVDKGNAKVKLAANIDTTNENGGAGLTSTTNLTFKGGGHVLDLNGHTLKLVTSVKDTHLIAVESQDMTIKDSSSSGSGRIEMEFGENLTNVQYPIYISGMGSLTIDGGTFSSSFNFVNYIECYGSLTINGGTIVSNSKRQVNLIKCEDANLTINGGKLQIPDKNEHGMSYGYAVYTENHFGDDRQIVITGGEIDGKVAFTRNDSSATGTPKYNKLPVKITGGVFKQKVYAYYSQKPSGEITEFSPAVELAGGTFKDVYNENLASSNGLATKLTAGTFEKSANIVTHVSGTAMAGYRACLGNSVILRGNECRTACDWSSMQGFEVSPTGMYFIFREAVVIPNAWGMKSVTLDGTTPINYAKDWYGTVERMDNSTAHTLTFEWYPLAQELKDAGYSYRTKCEHYFSGSTAVQQTDTIAASKTSHTITIEKGADPKVYSYDLQLNLQKDGSSVGIMGNEHIVKLVVNQAPVVEPDPTIEGSVYYTSGIVFGSRISTAASVTPASATPAYQWQRSTDGGSTWTNIEGATSGQYTPVTADMGENVRIRVKVTAESYLGEIVGAAVKVSKAANNNYPEVIQLEAVQDEAGNYIGFEITNFDSDCEYVYSTTDTPNWSANQISSATVTGLTSDTTYYVFARFKETNIHTAGSIVSKNSIRLYEYVPLDRVLLEGYDSGNTIYIKKGKSVTLKVSADPSNANSWKEITFKDSSLGTSNIAISNGTINASTGTATPFPNRHTITITGVSTGSATLDASYSGPTQPYYGRWNVVVYDDSTVANALRLENVYAYEDITLSVNDEAQLPTKLPKLLPENSGYHLEWRIVKVGAYGASYKTSDDNITLENGKIKPKAEHTGSEKTQLELVAVKDNSDTYSTLPKTPLFYVTVTEAPVIELTGLTVAPAKVNLELNATYQLSAVKEPVNATGSLTWASDKPEVAEVDTTGKVTAKAQGTAIITVTCGTKSASCTVTVGHTHDTDAQPWVYMDPGTHTKTCTAGDDFKVEAHDFNAWTKVDDINHSRTCSKCKKSGETANYTETANHNWQWVVDTAATPNAPGKQHEECVDCHVKRSENTEIPMLTSIMVEHLTVAKPVKDAAAAAATTTDSAYTVAYTEWTAADGTPLAIGDKFQPGTVYTAKITLETSGAGVFSAKSTYNPIEGKAATATPVLTGDTHADSVILSYTFDATEGSTGGSTGGGGGSGGGGVTTYAITVKDSKNGDVTASHKSAAKGTTVTLTVDPDKGFVLDTLTVLDGKDKEIKLTEKNGKYTFTMPTGKVTVKGSFVEEAPVQIFKDVPVDAYYYEAVKWAAEKGITGGVGNGLFAPNDPCTRAQIVTFLWRAAGSPAPKNMSSFTDVPADAFYAKADAWAVENGITGGTGDGKFSPDATCTRAQSVTFLYRAAGSPKVSGSAEFGDVATNAYYADAVAWAAKNGITGGIGGGLFGSGNDCTRAQIVTFLYNHI